MISDEGEPVPRQTPSSCWRIPGREDAESGRTRTPMRGRRDLLRDRACRRATREVVGQQADDLAEAQGDDRQVVAAQPQRRRAEEHAGQRGDAIATGRTASHAQATCSQPSEPAESTGPRTYAPTAKKPT